jgi:hypothetical protein
LRELAPHLPADQRAKALTEALTAATAIDNDWSRALALRELVPHLSADQVAEANSQALAASSSAGRSAVVETVITIIEAAAADIRAGASVLACLRWWP